MSERVQKLLARMGHGSRRHIESLLEAGEIRDGHGEPYRRGQMVDATDTIYLNGVQVMPVSQSAVRTRVIAYHKREGEISTADDPLGRPTVYDRLPRFDPPGKWISVGRLDINTTGLMLFSNDGELVHGLTHPSREVEREYRCRVFGQVTKRKLDRLGDGVRSDGDLLKFDQVEFINSAGGLNSWYRVVLKRGKNREIRRAWEAVECKVSRLIRIRYGMISLGDELKEGSWMELERGDVDALLRIARIPPK